MNGHTVHNTNELDTAWLNDGNNDISITVKNYTESTTARVSFYKAPAVECKLTELTCNSTNLNRGENLIVNYVGQNITKAKVDFIASTNVVLKTKLYCKSDSLQYR